MIIAHVGYTVSAGQSKDNVRLDRLGNLLREFQPEGRRMHLVLQRTLIRGILRSVRRRYLERLQRALTMYRDGQTTSAREAKDNAREAHRMHQAIALAYGRLDDAYLAGAPAKIADAKKRVARAQERLQDKLAQGSTTRPNALSAGRITVLSAAAGIMRARLMQILQELTATAAVTTPQVITLRGVRMAFIGAGDVSQLDQIETPSATEWLREGGARTASKKKVLWRQAELGTGIFARTTRGSAEGTNDLSAVAASFGYESAQGLEGVGDKQPWRFGGGAAGGIVLAGSKPMEFLTEGLGTSKAVQEHTRAAMVEFYRAMEEMLTLE